MTSNVTSFYLTLQCDRGWQRLERRVFISLSAATCFAVAVRLVEFEICSYNFFFSSPDAILITHVMYFTSEICCVLSGFAMSITPLVFFFSLKNLLTSTTSRSQTVLFKKKKKSIFPKRSRDDGTISTVLFPYIPISGGAISIVIFSERLETDRTNLHSM